MLKVKYLSTEIKRYPVEPDIYKSVIIILNSHTEAKPRDYVIVKNDNGEATFK